MSPPAPPPAPPPEDTVPLARRLWWLLEHLHAVTYFDEGCREAHRQAGLKGFWMGYFGCRAAPLGPVGPGVVEAVFFNFAPAMVRRAIPDAWGFCAPPLLVEVRRQAAADALRRLAPGIEALAPPVLGLLRGTVSAAAASGRPLFAANRDLAPAADPVAQLWQLATALREHRGDGHVALLSSAGLSGCEPHVLAAAGDPSRVEVLRDNRGWTTGDWQAAVGRLGRLGFLDGSGAPTDEGRRRRAEIEKGTDDLAAGAYESMGAAGMEELRSLLEAPARAVCSSGVIPYPNPIGLPPLG